MLTGDEGFWGASTQQAPSLRLEGEREAPGGGFPHKNRSSEIRPFLGAADVDFPGEKHLVYPYPEDRGVSIAQILRNSVPDVSSYLGTHDHALWAKRQLPKTVWDSLFKFAFVRNPWERLVSWYTMIQEQTARQAYQELRLWQYVIENGIHF